MVTTTETKANKQYKNICNETKQINFEYFQQLTPEKKHAFITKGYDIVNKIPIITTEYWETKEVSTGNVIFDNIEALRGWAKQGENYELLLKHTITEKTFTLEKKQTIKKTNRTGVKQMKNSSAQQKLHAQNTYEMCIGVKFNGDRCIWKQQKNSHFCSRHNEKLRLIPSGKAKKFKTIQETEWKYDKLYKEGKYESTLFSEGENDSADDITESESESESDTEEEVKPEVKPIEFYEGVSDTENENVSENVSDTENESENESELKLYNTQHKEMSKELAEKYEPLFNSINEKTKKLEGKPISNKVVEKCKEMTEKEEKLFETMKKEKTLKEKEIEENIKKICTETAKKIKEKKVKKNPLKIKLTVSPELNEKKVILTKVVQKVIEEVIEEKAEIEPKIIVNKTAINKAKKTQKKN